MPFWKHGTAVRGDRALRSTVAPLTTTVIAAVPGNQTGVASVASLFAISIFGALALQGALADGIRLATMVAALLALASTGCVVLSIRAQNR